MRIDELLTPLQRAILSDLAHRDAEERRLGIRNDDSLKALNPAVASFLTLLAVQSGARTIVEFGTSHGYSTIHLAAAAHATNGHLYTVDALASKTESATRSLAQVGLRKRVTLQTADGVAFAETLPDGVDFVLVDYGIAAFTPAFPALRARLAPGCILFCDGGPDDYWTTDPASRDFREALEGDPDFLATIIPLHKQQLMATYLPG